MQGNKGITRDVLEEHAAYQGYMLKQENKYKNKILNGILRSKACKLINFFLFFILNSNLKFKKGIDTIA